MVSVCLSFIGPHWISPFHNVLPSLFNTEKTGHLYLYVLPMLLIMLAVFPLHNVHVYLCLLPQNSSNLLLYLAPSTLKPLWGFNSACEMQIFCWLLAVNWLVVDWSRGVSVWKRKYFLVTIIYMYYTAGFLVLIMEPAYTLACNAYASIFC